MEMDVESYLRRRYEGQISDIEIVEKEDLNLVWFMLLTSWPISVFGVSDNQKAKIWEQSFSIIGRFVAFTLQ